MEKLNSHRLLIVFTSAFFLFGLAACRGRQQEPRTLPLQSLPAAPGKPVYIHVNAGSVTVIGTGEPDLTVQGNLAQPGDTRWSASDAGCRIAIQADYTRPFLSTFSGSPVDLEIRAPQGISLTVVTFDAAVSVRDFNGNLMVDSMSGNVEAQNLSGKVALRSGRGNVHIVGSSGELSIIGEHGLLTIENSRGQIGSATIMGTIHLLGPVSADDSVHLEADHGPVQVDLQETSDVSFTLKSASGDIRCLPGVTGTLRLCEGKLGSGAGKLTVRTVSGGVSIQAQP